MECKWWTGLGRHRGLVSPSVVATGSYPLATPSSRVEEPLGFLPLKHTHTHTYKHIQTHTVRSSIRFTNNLLLETTRGKFGRWKRDLLPSTLDERIPRTCRVTARLGISKRICKAGDISHASFLLIQRRGYLIAFYAFHGASIIMPRLSLAAICMGDYRRETTRNQ